MSAIDPIDVFLNQSQNKKLSLSALINTHSRLSMMQMRKGSVSCEDIIQTLRLSLDGKTGDCGERLEVDTDTYGALLYAAVLSPVFTRTSSPNQLVLQMKPAMLGNEIIFIQTILRAVKERALGGSQNPIVSILEKDAAAYLASIGETLAFEETVPLSLPSATTVLPNEEERLPVPSSVPTTVAASATPEKQKQENCLAEDIDQPAAGDAAASSSTTSLSPPFPPFETTTYSDQSYTTSAPPPPSFPAQEEEEGEDDHEDNEDEDGTEGGATIATTTATTTVAAITTGIIPKPHNPIVQFLSQIRRYGMVVLVPQPVHDQVNTISSSLSIYYVLILSYLS